jgi:hypothetical protein
MASMVVIDKSWGPRPLFLQAERGPLPVKNPALRLG